MKKLLLVMLFMVLLIPTVYSFSASIGNAKAVVRVNATPEDPAILERSILVNNKNDFPVLVDVFPNAEYEHFIDMHDTELEIAPGESERARYTATIDRGGVFDIKFVVQFAPADPEVKESGVGLTASLLVVSEGPEIEEPEPIEEEQPEEEQPQEAEEPEIVETEAPTEATESEEPEQETLAEQPASRPQSATSGNGPSPVVGLLIIAAIVVIGIAVIFFVLKSKK